MTTYIQSNSSGLRAVRSHKVIQKIGGFMFAKLIQIDDHIIAFYAAALLASRSPCLSKE